MITDELTGGYASLLCPTGAIATPMLSRRAHLVSR